MLILKAGVLYFALVFGVGFVQLAGTYRKSALMFHYEKVAAEYAVRRLIGVKDVTNIISVRRPHVSPKDIKHKIEQAAWPYWQSAPNAAALRASVLSDITSVMDFGIILGALLAAGMAGRFSPVWRVPAKSVLAAILGGLMLGYAARIAYGCNIGAYFSGIASSSVHGWVCFAAAFAGNGVGTRMRPRFGLLAGSLRPAHLIAFPVPLVPRHITGSRSLLQETRPFWYSASETQAYNHSPGFGGNGNEEHRISR